MVGRHQLIPVAFPGVSDTAGRCRLLLSVVEAAGATATAAEIIGIGTGRALAVRTEIYIREGEEGVAGSGGGRGGREEGVDCCAARCGAPKRRVVAA